MLDSKGTAVGTDFPNSTSTLDTAGCLHVKGFSGC